MNYKEHYKIDAEKFDYFNNKYITQSEKRRNFYVFNNIPVQKNDKILEIGSGRGWFVIQMAKNGFDTTAVDLSQKNLDTINNIEPNVNTAFGSAEELPFSNEKFDLIVMNEVLEHTQNPKSVLENLKKFLTPKGRIFISVPFNENIIQELCIHCHKLTPRNAHLHSFDSAKLNSLAEAAGYIVANEFTYLHKLFVQTGLIDILKFLPNKLFEIKDQLLCSFWKKPKYISIIIIPKN